MNRAQKLVFYSIKRCSEPKRCLGGHSRSLRKFTLAAAHAHMEAYAHLIFDDEHVVWMSSDELCEAIYRLLGQHAAVEKSRRSTILNMLLSRGILRQKISSKDKRLKLYGITQRGLSCAACIEMNDARKEAEKLY